jgi:tol-pal system protein YbgF
MRKRNLRKLSIILAVALMPATSFAAETQALEQRVERLERIVQGQGLIALMAKVDQLQNEIKRLNGENEALNHRIELLKESQRQMYIDLDQRVTAAPAQSMPKPVQLPAPVAPQQELTPEAAQTEEAATAEDTTSAEQPALPETPDNEAVNPAASEANRPTPEAMPADNSAKAATEQMSEDNGIVAEDAPVEDTADQTQQAASETPTDATATEADTSLPLADPNGEAAYQSALQTLRSGDYAAAVNQLKAFPSQYPQSNLLPNVYYWQGEAHYVLRQFDEALSAFQQVLEQFPNSNKAADALLKRGFSEFEKGDVETAKTTLNNVMQQYPNTSTARLARVRLDRIKEAESQ